MPFVGFPWPSSTTVPSTTTLGFEVRSASPWNSVTCCCCTTGTVVLEGQGNPTNGIVDSADAVVKVYVSATGTNPRSTLPLVTPPLHVVEGRVDTVHVTLMAANSTEAARVAELITQHTVLVAVDLVATIPAQAEPRGTVTLTALRATVTAERRQL